MPSYLMPKLVFGSGSIKKLPEEAAGFGKTAAILCSGSFWKNGLDELTHNLKKQGIASFSKRLSLKNEPTPETVDEAADFVKSSGADLVISVGGGSVIDTGKIAAGLAANGGKAAEYVENIGDKVFSKLSLPFFAAPTTSGTGSEMAKNGVVMVKGSYKNSIRSDMLLPKAAVVDPCLTLTLPPSVTASSGADALCQLIESYTTKFCTPYTDGISLKHIAPMHDALKRAVKDGSDLEAREILSIGASVSGICIANSGLGLAHGISASIGAVCGIKHGIGCGILMPHVARFNAKRGVKKYIDIARELGREFSDAVAAGDYIADVLTELNLSIGIPENLKEYNITQEELEHILKLTQVSSSTKKNPVKPEYDELKEFISSLI